ncbi:MAG TPA: hypothetical protein PLS49_00645 [Candidatus Woesebacteria bacterium]|nr:hypothetical protein [Candidatus Woesebacteria bacterium]
MNNEQLLRAVKAKLESGEMRREEVEQMLQTIPHAGKKGWNFSVTKMLYLIGAAIAVTGIIIFVSQIWEDIGSLGRISVTLGLGMLFAAFGSALLKQKPQESIGPIFHAMGGILIPSGAIVTLIELGGESDNILPVALTIGSIFLFYVALAKFHKHAVLTFFAIVNGTSFIYLLIESILQNSTYRIDDLYTYVTMSVGVSYILLAHSFKNTWNKDLVGVLCFFGSIAFFGAGATQVYDSGLWQIVYFVLLGIGLYISVILKSRSILIISTIFLLYHISVITSKYFADSIGWPITLVLLGFIFIGLGYSSFKISKKYIQS